MSNSLPAGDAWYLKDFDEHSINYGKTRKFDFTPFENSELCFLVKNYIWQNYRTGSRSISTLHSFVRYCRYFDRFINQRGIRSLRYLSNLDMDFFLSFLHTDISARTGEKLSANHQKGIFSSVRSLVYWAQIHMPNSVPEKEIFAGNEYRDVGHKLTIDFIPDDILTQIDSALKNEENPYIKNGIIILESTGMRVRDLLNLKTDCLKPHLISGYSLEWFEHKGRKPHPPMPVNNRCVKAIQELLFVTKELRNEADENIKDYLFIYRCKSGRFVGQIKQVNYENFALFYLPGFVKRHNIIDSDGNLYKLTCHQFRRTLGTDMLSKGTDINVIQQVLGHAEPATTKRFYADVKDKERAETFKSIGIVGNINLLDMSFFENEEELNWFHKHKDTSACLCDGYCTKPVVNGQVCDRLLRRQKCYTCSRYITTPEYLEAHKNHLAGLERQIAEGAIYGQHYAEHFLPTIEVLRSIIERLEEITSARD